MGRDGFWTTDPAEVFRVGPGFRLDEQDSRARTGFPGGKKEGAAALAQGASVLADLQERLFAAGTLGDQRSVLLVLQAMDTAGKGGIVKSVVAAMNPGGVHYASFGAPSPEELEHDFLWRVERELPDPGRVGVFDRSHYEDVLVGRVRNLAPVTEIERRYGAINDFERLLTESGTTIVKVMLNLGKDEQRARLARRLERRDKQWKYHPSDVDDRKLLGPVPARVPARVRADVDGCGALVRGPGRQEVVRASRRPAAADPRAGGAGPRVAGAGLRRRGGEASAGVGVILWRVTGFSRTLRRRDGTSSSSRRARVRGRSRP